MNPRENLIAARMLAGLSRPALAKMLGISRSHIHHVEIGVRNPSPELMRRWAIALKPSSPIWTDADIERMSLQLKPVATKTRRAA
jgi:transcriptional regulator with XRE-family HTH domain